MLLVVQKRSSICGIAQVITEIALDVHRRPTQVTALDQASHALCDVAELIVVPSGKLEAGLLRQRDEYFGLLCIYGERLLHVHMTATLQASLSDLKMAW